MSKLSFWIAISVFLSACSGEYLKKECLGNIEGFNENVLQKGISYQLAYLIEDKSVKVKFADQDIKVIMEQSLPGRVITNDGGNYFSFTPDNGGRIEYEFNPDKWFVGTCK